MLQDMQQIMAEIHHYKLTCLSNFSWFASKAVACISHPEACRDADYFPAEGGQGEDAFDKRLAALKSAKKQVPYGKSRREEDNVSGTARRCAAEQLA